MQAYKHTNVQINGHTNIQACMHECHALHCIALHCIALHYITLHYITLHYITLQIRMAYQHVPNSMAPWGISDFEQIRAHLTPRLLVDRAWMGSTDRIRRTGKTAAEDATGRTSSTQCVWCGGLLSFHQTISLSNMLKLSNMLRLMRVEFKKHSIQQ